MHFFILNFECMHLYLILITFIPSQYTIYLLIYHTKYLYSISVSNALIHSWFWRHSFIQNTKRTHSFLIPKGLIHIAKKTQHLKTRAFTKGRNLARRCRNVVRAVTSSFIPPLDQRRRPRRCLVGEPAADEDKLKQALKRGRNTNQRNVVLRCLPKLPEGVI